MRPKNTGSIFVSKKPTSFQLFGLAYLALGACAIAPEMPANMAAPTSTDAIVAQTHGMITPVTNAPNILPLSLHIGGRVVTETDANGLTQYRHQWPGTYFEAEFEGRQFFIRFGASGPESHGIYRLLVDGQEVGILREPVGLYLIHGLAAGRHHVRISSVSENQATPLIFGGIYLDAALIDGGQAAPARPNQIEFIGDSLTVSYGVVAPGRECTDAQVWAYTNNDAGWAAMIAGRLHADYSVVAISGRGIVRNYNGVAGATVPLAYEHTLLDSGPTWQNAAHGWSPKVIIMSLGANDFSTELHVGEPWEDGNSLRDNYIAIYLAFFHRLRQENPNATMIMWGLTVNDKDFHVDQRAVFDQLIAGGEHNLRWVSVSGLDTLGCNWHPSVADQTIIANAIWAAIPAE